MRARSAFTCRTGAAIVSASSTSRGTGRRSKKRVDARATRARVRPKFLSWGIEMDARFYRGLATTALSFALLAPSALSAETIRQWQFAPNGETSQLALREVEARKPAANEVAVRVHAVSLNRRDLMMVAGSYGRGGTQPNSVPLSDGAGEVV